LSTLRGFEWFHFRQRLHGEKLTITDVGGEAYAVTFTPDGRQIVSGGIDGKIRFWDTADGHSNEVFQAHTSCVNVLVYSPSERLLASASCDHTVKLWDAATHELVATLQPQLKEVMTIAFSPDGSQLAVAGNSPRVQVWDVAS